MLNLAKNIRYFWFSVNQSGVKGTIKVMMLACVLDITMILFHFTFGTPLVSIMFICLLAVKFWSAKSVIRFDRRAFEGHTLKKAKEKKKNILEERQAI